MLAFHFLKYAAINQRHLYFSKKQIKQLQQKKFTKLVRFAAKNSPYYQKIIKERQINIDNCIPEDFPILSKAEFIEEFDNIVTDKNITKAKIDKFLEHSHNHRDLFLNKYYLIHTSGSSGTISRCVYSEKEYAEGVVFQARTNGIKFFQKVAGIILTQGHFAGVTMIDAASKLPIMYKETKLFDLNSPFADILEKLNKMQPTILVGYAHALRKLAEAQNKKKLNIKPRVVQSAAEPLSAEDKRYIQHAFQAPIINIYASSECLFMGMGKDEFNGTYLMEDNLIFEIHKRFMCVTNLYNYTLPLIRYQMSDHLVPIYDKQNQMPFIKIKEIIGRDEHVPVFINDKGEEDFISPCVFIDFYVKNLKQFQVYIIDKRSFVFKACLESKLTKEEAKTAIEKIEKRLQGILWEKMMKQVKFSVEIVNNLSVDSKTGKFKLVINS